MLMTVLHVLKAIHLKARKPFFSPCLNVSSSHFHSRTHVTEGKDTYRYRSTAHFLSLILALSQTKKTPETHLDPGHGYAQVLLQLSPPNCHHPHSRQTIAVEDGIHIRRWWQSTGILHHAKTRECKVRERLTVQAIDITGSQRKVWYFLIVRCP